jgi:hypothetical protein
VKTINASTEENCLVTLAARLFCAGSGRYQTPGSEIMLAAVRNFDTERQRGRHELGTVGMLTIPARAADRSDE